MHKWIFPLFILSSNSWNAYGVEGFQSPGILGPMNNTIKNVKKSFKIYSTTAVYTAFSGRSNKSKTVLKSS